jgi:hypothetical protein
MQHFVYATIMRYFLTVAAHENDLTVPELGPAQVYVGAMGHKVG